MDEETNDKSQKKRERKEKMKKIANDVGNKQFSVKKIFLFFLVVMAVGIAIYIWREKKDYTPEVNTISSLEKVVETSKLSTYQTVFNGIAVKENDKDPKKVDYYVRYEGSVKAGFDFAKIIISEDKDAKNIVVTLPEIELQDPIVKIESLDFIVVNKKIDRKSIIAPAYKLAEDDVREESSKQEAIKKYARQNAENLIEGLLTPFVNQFNDDYTIVFN
ncbi:MAG: DUF4230 domain-containing protein [Erysipelotrichaceae bacterium]|nr:DUF4230 domain-containing protein [Erysipelotrichaceae bacterium]MDY5251940.1 DUF4230 domain-containing protein [Erysipelotrichaceae bacterium]